MSRDDSIREEILTAARRVFQKWGLKKSTMEDIAAEAGKAKSTLYYYYSCKEEIFDEAVIDQLEMVLADAKMMVAAITPVKEKLKVYVIKTLTGMKKHAEEYANVWEEIKSNPLLLRKVRERFESGEQGYFIEMLGLGVQTGEFHFSSERELTVAAHTLAGMVRALFLYLFIDAGESEQIDIAARLLANGI